MTARPKSLRKAASEQIIDGNNAARFVANQLRKLGRRTEPDWETWEAIPVMERTNNVPRRPTTEPTVEELTLAIQWQTIAARRHQEALATLYAMRDAFYRGEPWR